MVPAQSNQRLPLLRIDEIGQAAAKQSHAIARVFNPPVDTFPHVS